MNKFKKSWLIKRERQASGIEAVIVRQKNDNQQSLIVGARIVCFSSDRIAELRGRAIAKGIAVKE